MIRATSFPELIEGKSIAIVGPAVSVGDQSEQVEACDTVIRCNYRWNGAEAPTGYGERLDVAFYSIFAAQNLLQNQTLLDSLPCVVLKHGSPQVPHPNARHAVLDPFDHANQVPIILNDIEQFNPSAVWIFGADFYSSGFEDSTQATYRTDATLEQTWKDLNTHDQRAQHEWMKAFQDRTGLVKGDSRMVELLSISTDELMTRLNNAWENISD